MPEVLITEHTLQPHEARAFDADSGNPLFDHSEVMQMHGLAVPALAQVRAHDQIFRVLDTRQAQEFATPMLIVSEDFTVDDYDRHYKGVRTGDTVTIGRAHHADRFDYSPYVSASHFEVTYNGLRLVVKNLRPTNGTKISADQTRQREFNSLQASFTRGAHDNVKNRHDFGGRDAESPYGYFKNHPIIGRNSASVKNGVYFTVGSEAVVVDDRSRLLQNTVAEFSTRIDHWLAKQPTLMGSKAILEQVNKFTQDKMSYDLFAVDRLCAPHYDNGLIGLSEYVHQGIGVCRHQCLLAALLIESLHERGYLMGKRVAVERNHDLEVNGAHAWAVFEDHTGTEIVIDPAQDFVGTKGEARRQGRWRYSMPVSD